MTGTLSYTVSGETGHPRSIVVLLHGSGQNADDMAHAAGIFSREIPDALFLIPNGSRPLPGCAGFDWFRPDFNGSAQQLAFNLQPALDGLDDLIDAHLRQHGLTDRNLALFGFSMGGMAAIYEGLRRPQPCAAVLCHSSIYPQAIDANAKPPVVMVMGEKNIAGIDEDIRNGLAPAGFTYGRSVARLQQQGIPVAEYIVPGLRHEMSGFSLQKAAQIVRDGLNGGAGIRAGLLPAPAESPPGLDHP